MQPQADECRKRQSAEHYRIAMEMLEAENRNEDDDVVDDRLAKKQKVKERAEPELDEAKFQHYSKKIRVSLVVRLTRPPS